MRFSSSSQGVKLSKVHETSAEGCLETPVLQHWSSSGTEAGQSAAGVPKTLDLPEPGPAGTLEPPSS